MGSWTQGLARSRTIRTRVSRPSMQNRTCSIESAAKGQESSAKNKPVSPPPYPNTHSPMLPCQPHEHGKAVSETSTTPKCAMMCRLISVDLILALSRSLFQVGRVGVCPTPTPTGDFTPSLSPSLSLSPSISLSRSLFFPRALGACQTPRPIGRPYVLGLSGGVKVFVRVSGIFSDIMRGLTEI